jgi:hypothetical protein
MFLIVKAFVTAYHSLILQYSSSKKKISIFDMYYNIIFTAGNRHKQNSWFCKEIRVDSFRCWWRRVHEDASQSMYMSKIEIFFLLLEYCKIREWYAVRLQFTSDESEFIPDYIQTPMMKKYWKFNLHLCQDQLRNARVSHFWSCFSWDDCFCESYSSYTTINYTCF